ncbi:2OG-Fe(II) oxygenase [Erythrobacter crassostreae]|uniref:2OG-Fe(II) oxygenase n=1 Tax=Erythrobacter crassostreae TaxID=2828328 RepID=A0A9X1JMP9_9SPHN|nr:2OG-Fe(II) oxygenase [Erythrobacter crassostrea]MBV7259644.1 2OG-Fe(II) oxygenase [Erythrobacter crassostrea]
MTGRNFDPDAVRARPTVLPGMASTFAGQVASPPVISSKSATEVRHARSLNGKPIGLIPDFITEQERAALYKYASADDAPWETCLPKGDVWHGRLINPGSVSPKILKMMENIRKRTVAHIKAEYEITDPVYADTLQLVRWRPGDNQAPHADCEEPDGQPNATPWRAFASIIYLNDGYEGGGIHFPDRKLKPEIKPRTLAYFPSTNKYRHGVEAITSGLRYTMSCFYTFDARRHDGHLV